MSRLRQKCRLVDNSEIYGPKVLRAGNTWVCPGYPDCDHYIAARSDCPDPLPVGTMAGPRLRVLRSKLYQYLKPQCHDHRSKVRVYRDLSAKMGWQGRLNISALNEENCLKALKIVDPDFVDRSPTTQTDIPQSWQDRD